MRFTWTGCDWSMCRNLNILEVVWTDQVQMMQSLVGRWRVGGGLQVLLGLCLLLGLFLSII